MWTTVTTLALTALALPATGDSRGPIEDGIAWWSGSFEAAAAAAVSEDRPLVVYFWMEESEHCAQLYGQTLVQPDVAAALESWIAFSAQVTTPEGRAVVARYGVTTLPTLLFLTPQAAVEDAVIGTITPQGLQSELDRIRAGQGTLSTLRGRLAEAPQDLMRRLDLAVKLRDVGQIAEADELLASIRVDDPRQKTEAGARLALWDAMDAVGAEATPGDLESLDLEPIAKLLAKTSVAAVRFEGWQYIAEMERERGRRGEARAAAMAAWPDCPGAQRTDWSVEVAETFWDAREELQKRERRFALTLAEAAVDGAEEFVGEAEAQDPDRLADGTGYLGTTLNLLARCQLLNGQERSARKTAERCLELEPGRPEHERLAEIVKAR